MPEFTEFRASASERESLVAQRPHLSYVFDILDGRLAASEPMIAVARRTVFEHLRPEKMERHWIFRQDLGDSPCQFAALLPHVRGSYARRGLTIEYEPWQRWLVTECYGWRDPDDHYIRRYQDMILEVSKKNGKTTLDSTLALYELRYGDVGGEIYSMATKSGQARKCWYDALKIIEKMPDWMADGFESRGESIFYRSGTTENKFEYLSKGEKSMDGPDPNMLIVDEAAAVTDEDGLDKLTKSMGSRDSPLAIWSTHAQYNQRTVYFAKRSTVMKALEGSIPIVNIERVLAAIYCLDEEAEHTDQSAWEKANPNIGKSVQVPFLQKLLREAEIRPRDMNSFLTYNMNLWLKSAARWLVPQEWEQCAGEVKRHGPCIVGVDLSATQDLTAVCRLWRSPGERWHVDWRFWCAEDYLDELPDDLRRIYDDAVASGILEICPGPIIETGQAIDYVLETRDEFGVERVCIDPWKAKAATTQWDDQGIPTTKVSQAMASLADDIDTCEAKIVTRRIVHDGNYFVQWQFGNCHVKHYTDRELKQITKPPDNDHEKIDAFAALFTAAHGTVEKKEPEKDFRVRLLSASGEEYDINEEANDEEKS